MSKNIRRAALAAALAAGFVAPFAAQAQSGPWMVRVHALSLDSANKDSTGLGLSVNNKVFPEFDISYFFTPNLAAELVLTYPQKHDIRSNGTKIGTLKHLPPTLSVQYHFTGLGAFKPYVGGGLNYTRFSSVNFDPVVASLGPSIEKSSVGAAVGVGFDVEVANNIYLNLDVKKVQIRTDVKSNGVKAGEFRVDPLLVGVGVGMRF
ncbi:MAG: OmpW family protein [Piscinibacter sp.]|uniref:OmpW/AlkL family protein n=1 Tax=Piscinibacter sp. TaxID=1903157 RepID=UPI00258CB474|nr:OmpW family outer membrane protein [Piscinibacter sp.]MCW5667621.1 OmpW family protein [Piscinibacter sp.]